MPAPATTPPKPAPWYEIKALHSPSAAANSAPAVTIHIYGNIGDNWSGDGVVASDLVRELAQLDASEIALRINSFGGSVTDGIAIYNAIKRHPAPVTTHIDGVAISIASLIAMAGDTICIAQNAQMMIHAPWTFAAGNAPALRDEADLLDRYAKSMAPCYAEKSGKKLSDVIALLTDGVDHWYSADEAVAAGFADTVGAEVPVAASLASQFDLSRFRAAAPQASTPPQNFQPTAAAVTTQEHTMPAPQAPAAQPAAPSAPAAALTPTYRTKADNDWVLAMFKPFTACPEIQALQTTVLADPTLSMEQIQSRLLTAVGKDNTPATPQNSQPGAVQTVADETDKRREAMVNALLVRAGVEHDPKVRASMSANPFRGHKLLDIARASLDTINFKTHGMGQMEVVAAAFTQGTSDFPVLLELTMHKSLLNSYTAAALTWNRFCATGSVGDFRAHHRYRMGSFGTLDDLNELGEFVNKSIPDGEKSSITASTKGNIISLSRQAVINDDLGAFVGLSNMLGGAAARTIEKNVYAMLALNAGLGPVMSDGKTLFHADHKNMGSASAISMLALDADRVLMASQMDISGEDFLDLRPSVMLLPIGLGGIARAINSALYDPDTANKLQKPNIVNGLFSDIVDTPRLSGTRRYLFANSSEAPVLEVAFLDGNQSPFLEMQDGFDVDGARYKVRLDYGIAAVDYRGAVTNAGV